MMNYQITQGFLGRRNAQDWLENNEGDGVEGEACKIVAKWLNDQAQMIAQRNMATELGVPVERLRAKMKEKGIKEISI